MKSGAPKSLISLARTAAVGGARSPFPLSQRAMVGNEQSQRPPYNQRKARKARRQAHAAGIKHAFRR